MANKLMESLERIGECMPGGFFVYIADDKEEMIYVNDVVLDMFGCETLDEYKELTGYTFQGLVYPEDLDAIQNSIKVQVGHNERRLDYVEYRIRRKDGELRWMDDYGRLVHTEEYGEVYFVLIRDITDLKKQEEDKRVAEQALEREKHLNDIRTEFMTHVSQDIRVPMHTISEYTELAMAHIDDPENLKIYLEKISSSSRQMITMTEELLEMSLLDTEKVKINETEADIRGLVRDTIGVFHEAAMEKRIDIKERIQVRRPYVFLDEMNFRKIMYNILSNAIKFTDPDGTVTVQVGDGKTSESGYARYEISVTDTGVGMTEDFQQKLYDVFSIENSDGEASSGIGIGLSITKKLVDAMGGTISVTSKKGEGSTFSIGLPLRMADSSPDGMRRPLSRPSSRDGKRQRILLAEDVEINRVLAEQILTMSGFDVESVTDGSDAVKAVDEHPEKYYDLILMDTRMPVMSGPEATRLIRDLDRPDTDTIPIIALSTNARDDEKRKCIESGMNTHLSKPFDMTTLIDTIKIYLSEL